MLGCLPHETTRSVPAQQGFIGAGIKDKKTEEKKEMLEYWNTGIEYKKERRRKIKEMLNPVKPAPLAFGP